MERICKQCQIKKPIEDFFKNKKSKYGHLLICKKCTTINAKEYYKNNPNKKKSYNKSHYKSHYNPDIHHGRPFSKEIIINKCGVYKLVSKKDSDIFYIGASENLIRRRLDHISLSISKHSGIKRHQIKYGINDLEFKIIKICPAWQLQFWEQYFISETEPSLNVNKFASSIENGNEARIAAFENIAVDYFCKEKEILEYLDYEIFKNTYQF